MANPGSTSVRVWHDKNTIFMKGRLCGITATLVENALTDLGNRNKKKKLYFIIDSLGGDFYVALKIFYLLKKWKGKVVTVVFGSAHSGGLTIFQCGDKRIMTKKSKLRFHHANLTFLKNQTLEADELRKLERQLFRIDGVQLAIYSHRVKPDKVRELFKLFEKTSAH